MKVLQLRNKWLELDGFTAKFIHWNKYLLTPAIKKKKKRKSLSHVRLSAIPWMVCSSSIHGILQARILEWVAVSFSSSCHAASAAKSLQSCLTLCDPRDGSPGTSTRSSQSPPSLGFSRQEHWIGLPFPSPMHESEKWKWSHSVVSNS